MATPAHRAMADGSPIPVAIVPINVGGVVCRSYFKMAPSSLSSGERPTSNWPSASNISEVGCGKSPANPTAPTGATGVVKSINWLVTPVEASYCMIS